MDFLNLLEQARRGDGVAIAALLEELRPDLEGIARRYVRDDAVETVSDLVQEAWLRAWRGLDGFAGDGPPGDRPAGDGSSASGTDDASDEAQARASLTAWARQITHNVGKQRWRDRHRQKRSAPLGSPWSLGAANGSAAGLDPAASGTSPSGRFRRAEDAERVRAAIRALDDSEEREVVLLRFFDGLSFGQIAERLGLTYDQVRQRFHKGMRQIGARLEER